MKTDFISNIPATILRRLKTIDLDVPSENAHKAMDELMKNSVLMGGKRLRPLLTYLFADFYGLPLDRVDVAARSVEMVHAASLAHDDVIDEAKMRRGIPSINVQASNKKAVLAGDYLLAAVIGELSRTGELSLVKEMATVIELLAQGEWLQSDLIESRQYTAELIDDIAFKKTASVMSWCAVAPALLSQQGPEIINYGRQFGHHLGLAFQQLDDTLDFSGESRKDSHLDLKNGQVNSVVFEWLLLNKDELERFQKGENLYDLFHEKNLDKALQSVQKKATGHLDSCRDLIEVMKKEMMGTRSEKELDKSAQTFLFIIDYLEKRRF